MCTYQITNGKQPCCTCDCEDCEGCEGCESCVWQKEEKMAEYIEREKVLNALSVFNDRVHGNEHFLNGIETAKEIVGGASSADVAPVVHGEWTAEGNDEKGNYWDECTACRKSVWFPPFVKNDYKYCPHCGAKMDGGN